MELLFKDFRFALRMLAKHPGITLVVIVTLGLGIGANTAIFSFVNAVLLRPLPYHEPERLVLIQSERGGEEGRISLRELVDMREQLTSYVDLAAYVPNAAYNISDHGPPEEASAILASHNLFEVLGVDLLHGELWPEEYDVRRSHAVILNHAFWQRRYQGDPAMVGQQITMDMYPSYTVHGILPLGTDFPFQTDIFRSRAFIDMNYEDRSLRSDLILGRLRKGISYAEAQDELERLGTRLAQEFPDTNLGLSFRLKPLQDLYVGAVRPYLWALSAAVFLVLGIACINVLNLLLARATSREKEMAVRTALGAGRGRLTRQVLVESVILALLGGALGLGLAFWGVAVLTEMVRVEMPFWMDITIDGGVLGFAITLAVLSGLIVGVVPARRATRIGLSQLLKAGRGTVGGHRHRIRRNSLVIAELALAVLLLTGSGLLVKSFLRVQRVDLGFNPDEVLTFRVALSWRTYDSAEKIRGYHAEAVRRLEALPGVLSASFDTNLPLTDEVEANKAVIALEGQSPEAQQRNPYVDAHQVGGGYFDVMGIPVLRGRTFTAFDVRGTTPVAMVSTRLAERLWPGQDPIGQRLRWGDPNLGKTFYQIIGVVGNVKHEDLDAAAGLDLYVPVSQYAAPNVYYVLRTSVPPLQVAEAATEAMLRIDPGQSTYEYMTMTDRVADKLWRRNVTSTVFLVFAFVATLLAAIGVYSVISYAVNRRTREIGVRKALGALQHEVLALVLREVAVLAVIGVGLGVLAAVGLSPMLKDLLYEVSATDPAIFLAAPVLLTAVALLAAFLPALRAARVNPVTALRHD